MKASFFHFEYMYVVLTYHPHKILIEVKARNFLL